MVKKQSFHFVLCFTLLFFFPARFVLHSCRGSRQSVAENNSAFILLGEPFLPLSLRRKKNHVLDTITI